MKEYEDEYCSLVLPNCHGFNNAEWFDMINNIESNAIRVSFKLFICISLIYS